jgi:eukaryotic translation initiation factor 2C
LKSYKCRHAKPHYLANVCLKINVKLGGMNTVPEPRSVSFLTDPQNPTMVMGCDTMHPAPGSEGRPSFASLVANVDSEGAKYIATSSVQEGRVEMVENLKSMTELMINKFIDYRTHVEKRQTNRAPKRILFFRDGVSEGQFKQVLEQELPLIKEACKATNISPKITVIIVGKRHHVRFFPAPNVADRSGNCPAGTVVDTDVVHPTEFDFYLQSHGGLLGTSRPAHYSVLSDDNGFSADGLQMLAFALCHVYARATRSVSIPAPVYYADIVCSRAKNHYDPEGGFNFSDESASGADNQTTLSSFKSRFQPINPKQAVRMYFS